VKHLLSFSFIHLFFSSFCLAQNHPRAHAHNDYEHAQPLKEAMQNGFLSVEVDTHLFKGKLVVAHDTATASSPSLERLYLRPLDSLLRVSNGFIYPGEKRTFFLMIDIKTDGPKTYRAFKQLMTSYAKLKCVSHNCPVKIFLSGERPLNIMIKEGYTGIGIDGRPDDLGKGYPKDMMPVISDAYKNWSTWDGISPLKLEDFQRINRLSQRVHAEGKMLRLWAIPDHEIAWQALLDAGVDLINTDHLQRLNAFLKSKGE